MKHALYIIGEPGAGKSTLVETLVGDALVITGRKPLAHRVYLTVAGGVTELGAREPGRFGGTDALSMSAVVPAEAWVIRGDWPHGSLLLAEGDRLACDRFFDALLAGGWDLAIIRLSTRPEVAAARREARGSFQKEAWVRGRQTKVARLADRWAEHVYTFDGTAPPEQLARQAAAVSPVAAALYDPEEVAA